MPNDPMARLRALETWLRERVTAAFQRAWAVEEPAGTSDEWQAVLLESGVQPIDARERDEVRAAQRPLRGAPVMELAQVMHNIAVVAERELGFLELRDKSTQAEELAVRLRHAIEMTKTRAVDAYRRAVLPQRAGMFAHATAHAGALVPKKTGAVAPVLTCRSCGAPRLSEELVCAFCGQPMQ